MAGRFLNRHKRCIREEDKQDSGYKDFRGVRSTPFFTSKIHAIKKMKTKAPLQSVERRLISSLRNTWPNRKRDGTKTRHI
jgi:hypothetical protein